MLKSVGGMQHSCLTFLFEEGEGVFFPIVLMGFRFVWISPSNHVPLFSKILHNFTDLTLSNASIKSVNALQVCLLHYRCFFLTFSNKTICKIKQNSLI